MSDTHRWMDGGSEGKVQVVREVNTKIFMVVFVVKLSEVAGCIFTFRKKSRIRETPSLSNVKKTALNECIEVHNDYYYYFYYHFLCITFPPVRVEGGCIILAQIAKTEITEGKGEIICELP